MISNPAIRLGAWAACVASLVLLMPGVARADLQIDITQGVTDPIPIAIVPFARAVPADGGVDVAAIVQRDLESSGRFKPMARTAMLSQPSDPKSLHTNDWKAAGNDYVAIGRVVANGTSLSVETELFNALTGQSLGTLKVSTEAATMRGAAHRVSDFIYEKVIGTRGAFATRVAYVSVDGAPPNQRYQLIVADSDGESPKIILSSRLPIMSPSWSPDGQWLAYVSFENNASAIYVQQLRTGERRRVSARAGVNSSPSWSPDGKRLALTLSGSAGNLDVYVLDLVSQALTRITDDPAIDTEAVWSRDGNQIYFTSDRAGGAQIYKADVTASARAQRVTFGSGYAARARLSPDGRQLAFVTLQGSDYRIAVRDENGNVRVLSKGALDESPSFAPNGMTLIYAGRNGAQGVLATVSTDGLVTQRLKSDQGEVREPVWGPFLP